jgi:hypothetical protein
MQQILVELIPLIIGAALVPLQIILVLFILRGERGVLKATAFVGGMATMRILQGLIFGFVFTNRADSSGGGTMGAVLQVFIGILLWAAALKTFMKQEDPDAPPPKWMTMFDSITPLKAFAFGALLILIAAKLWAFTLSALAVISNAPLMPSESVIAFLLYVLLASSLLIIPILWSLLAPRSAETSLARLGSWLERNNRVIVIVVAAIFGSFFLWRGISALLGG